LGQLHQQQVVENSKSDAAVASAAAADSSSVAAANNAILELEKKRDALLEEWRAVRSKLDEINKTREEMASFKADYQQARRANDRELAETRLGQISKHEASIASGLEEIRNSKFPHMGKCLLSEDIADIVSKNTGIPCSNIMEGERKSLLDMEAYLRKRVKGQDAAISSIAKVRTSCCR
jgi:ATP-dependent Clp protease ATP-binding subunit ClpA